MMGKIINSLIGRLDRIHGENVIGNSKQYWLAFSVVTLLIALYPFFATTFETIQMTVYFIWVFLALSLALVWGYTGIFSFGQIAFFGLGGYLFGIVGLNLIDITGATNIALLSAVVGPMIFAAIIGYFMFYGRVSGVYVAIITLSVTLIFELLLSSSTGVSIGAADLGGYNGMTHVPGIIIGTSSTSFEFTNTALYYLVIFLIMILYLGIRYLVNTNFGYAMIAIREDQDRAEMLGYDIRFFKLIVFSIAGGIAGLGGAVYAAWGSYMDPTMFGLLAAALPIIWVTVGGRKTLIGPMIAAVSIQYFDDALSSYNASATTILIGATLIAVILLAPSGLIPKLNSLVSNSRFMSNERTVDTTEQDRKEAQ